MGLSNYPSPAEGVLPVLVMNTVISVALLKNMIKSMLEVVGASWVRGNQASEEESSIEASQSCRLRRVSITRYDSLCRNRRNSSSRSGGDRTSGGSGRCGGGATSSSGSATVWPVMECCVCLCRFEADEEVSELSCRHFFHKGCLEKWFDNQHTTCPLCRSIM